jgi:heme/copper-type cytochrome/quinol oxidase subunit 1
MIGAPDMAFPRMNNVSFWPWSPRFCCWSVGLSAPARDHGAGAVG